jgi:hypothetical protein
MAHGDGSGREGDRPSERPAKSRGPLVSKYPGELALRDAAGATVLEAQLCTARFAVLQLAERYAASGIDVMLLTAEIEAAEAYVSPMRERGPADALRLSRILDGMRRGQVRSVTSAFLAAGDTARAAGQVYAATGFHRAAYDLALRIGWNAAALSAASRVAELAVLLQKPRTAARWQRCCAEQLAACR